MVVNLAAHSLTAKTTCTGELAVDWKNNNVYYSYHDGASPHPNALDVYDRDTDTISLHFQLLGIMTYLWIQTASKQSFFCETSAFSMHVLQLTSKYMYVYEHERVLIFTQQTLLVRWPQ